jgi:hypothetical protein
VLKLGDFGLEKFQEQSFITMKATIHVEITGYPALEYI